MEWQPIETAPKDGTYVILWTGCKPADVKLRRWSSEYGVWTNQDDSEDTGPTIPTHWIPAAPPPVLPPFRGLR